MQQMNDQTLGVLVIVVFGVLWVGIGLWVARRVRRSEHFIVAGRDVGVALGAATILATWVTGNTILAAPESGYTYGVLGVIGYGIGAGVAIVAFAPLAKRIRILMPHGRTVGDFFRLRYDSKNYGLFLVMLIVWDLGWLLTQAMAAGILLETVFGIDFHVAVVTTVVLVTVYVAIGGMVSVLATDFMQTMLILGLVLVFPVWVYLSAGPADVYEGMRNLAPDQLNLANSAGLVFMVALALLAIGEVFMDNAFWQRAFALRPNIVGRAFTFAGAGWIFVPLATGSLAWVALGTGMEVPGGPSSVGPAVVAEYAGRLGSTIFLVVLWAALASTMAALLNAVASLLMNDIFNNFVRKAASDRLLLLSGRMSTVVVAVIVVALAWPRPLTLLTLLILLGSINAAYIPPIVMGLFFHRTNKEGAFWGAVLGAVAGLFVFGSGGFKLLYFTWEIYPLPEWLGGALRGPIIAFAISSAVTIVATLLRPQPFDFRELIRWRRAVETEDVS
jgi:SSS family transporter